MSERAEVATCRRCPITPTGRMHNDEVSRKETFCYNKHKINPESPNSREKRLTLPANTTLAELDEMLAAGKVPIETYGTGNAKTIDNLLAEVNEGESIITIDNEGAVYRTVSVLGVDIFCELSNGSVYHLKEDREEF